MKKLKNELKMTIGLKNSLGSISIYDTFLAPPTLKQYMVN
jgi:hypothetical protein